MENIFKRINRRLKKEISLASNKIIYSILPAKVECNFCHYKTDKFQSDDWHLYSICPNCLSSVRHRLLFGSLFQLKTGKMEHTIKNKEVLHFAPEGFMQKLFVGTTSKYKTADFFAEGYDYSKIDFRLDISDMPDIKNESYDCIIACDVLEHVPNDTGAIKEAYRILRKGGYCIFTVPQKDNLKITFEDLSVVDPHERIIKFGQLDHLRIYGDDFVDKMKENGFEVTTVDASQFEKEVRERFVLAPPILSENPLATNYRKIFYGLKK